MHENRPYYLSYLLRLWRTGRSQVSWQASLESPITGKRKGFSNLESLFDFIRVEMHQATSLDKPNDQQSSIDDKDEAA